MSVRVKGTHFVRRDGTPLFWLADTAWNAPLRGNEQEWNEYVKTRAKQGFTFIQFVATQWRGCRNPIYGPLYETAGGDLQFNSVAVSKMDQWIQMINEHRMVAAPVMLWAHTRMCPGQSLSEPLSIKLGRWMIKRWKNRDIVWLLAGDGDYSWKEAADRWKRIGNAIFSDIPEAVVTMHPCGLSWVGDIFANQPWFSFVGIQSGHGNKKKELKWLLKGPFSTKWQKIKKPFVNLEPNYEGTKAYATQDYLTDYHVRRAAYWSLLSAPPAGITYGNNSVWIWGQHSGERADGHGDNWIAGPWREGLETKGVQSMIILNSFFQKLPWTHLRPAQELLVRQPGDNDITEFVKVAATEDQRCIVAYMPRGQRLCLRTGLIGKHTSVYWVDPRIGQWLKEHNPRTKNLRCLMPPDNQDWLLVVTNETNTKEEPQMAGL